MSDRVRNVLERRSAVAEAMRVPLTDATYCDVRAWITRTDVVMFVGDQVRWSLRAQILEEVADE